MREGFLLDLMGLDVPVKHQINRRLKHVYLQIKPQGLIVKTPGWSEPQIKNLLLKQEPWITQQYENGFTQKQSILPKEVLFLGKLHCLNVELDATRYGQTHHAANNIHLFLPPGLDNAHDQGRIVLERFFKDQARTIMYDRLIDWACKMSLSPQIVRFKKLKSRWGSCSSKGSINLNYRAIQLPLECIDSILVHELAHLQHLNHSKDFWNLVYRFIPDYPECHAKIKSLERDILS